MAGDFNSIRRDGEIVGRRVCSNRNDTESFDLFIRDSGLIDLPLNGRSFTWYKADGSYKSLLDRIRVNNEWMNTWLESSQRGLHRTISDHCPIILEVKVQDWGPKPFKCLNAWFTHPNFK